MTLSWVIFFLITNLKMEVKMNAFQNYVPTTRAPRSLDMLDAGQYLVKIEDMAFEDDRTGDNAGTKDWDDVNDVLYLYLVGEDGVHHLRYYLNGYWKYEDLLKDASFANELRHYRKTACDTARGYAIDVRTNRRVLSKKNTDFARQLLDEFCTAAGSMNENRIEDMKACALQDLKGKVLWIELTPEILNGKRRMKLLRVAGNMIGFKSPARANVQSGLVMPEIISSNGAKAAW